MLLVAPYCAIPRDYLSDTPLLRAMGFLVSQHSQKGWRLPPPPFWAFSLESMHSGGAIPPPPPKGYLSDTRAIPYVNKAKRVRYPPLRYYLGRVLRDMGGVSRTGPLRKYCGRSKNTTISSSIAYASWGSYIFGLVLGGPRENPTIKAVRGAVASKGVFDN